jgi:DNA segregation ATPase FtsK/SpoIIIE-like protein
VIAMTDRQESGFELRRDGLGILLFTLGAFFTVLLVLALASTGPLEKAEGTGALARLWASSLGLFPALVFFGGCAILGARLFLAGVSDLRRDVGGLALVTLGLSVLLGAFSGSAGGLVGSLTAGAIAHATHVAVGALVGLVALAAAVWIAWLRPARGGVLLAGSAEDVEEDRVKPAAPQASDLGVSAAEAAALIPSEIPSVANPAVAVTTRRIDLRRIGEIPEGARPILTPHVHTPTAPSPPQPIDEPSAPSLEHWTPAPEPGMPADAADEDLARAEEPEPVPAPVAATLVEIEAPEDEIEEEVSELEVEEEEEEEVAEEELEIEEPQPEAELEAEEPEAEDSEPVLRPSWEQPTLFQEGEEPVDAYGTPLSLVPAEEDDVVLQPVPAPAKKKASREGQEEEHSRFLAEVGCLFVDRGRVAVSMLQKQFDMDFEEATEVLDELQALGLIGPYLGGQRRDILLTRDEWLEKVSSL